MITTKLTDGRQVAVKFYHSKPVALNNKRVGTIGAPTSLESRTTEAALAVINGDDVLPLGVGKAACHPGDNFDRRKGRKLALTRVLSVLDKADRGLVWDAYLKATSAQG